MRGELPATKTGRGYLITRQDLAEYLGSMDRVDAIFGPEEESWGCFTARRRASCSKRKTPAPESRDGRSLLDAPLLLWKAERCTHADSARSISMVRHRTALFKPERSPLFFCREDPAIRVCAEHVRCRRFYLSKPRRTASHICFNRVNPAPLTERKGTIPSPLPASAGEIPSVACAYRHERGVILNRPYHPTAPHLGAVRL